MNYTTFEGLLLNCKDLYETTCARDRRLEEVLGGNTQVTTDFWDQYITKTLEIISEAMGDTTKVVEQLFWKDVCSNSKNGDSESGIVHEGNMQNVYFNLMGTLNGEYYKHKDARSNEQVNGTPCLVDIEMRQINEEFIEKFKFNPNYTTLNTNMVSKDGYHLEIPIAEYNSKKFQINTTHKKLEFKHITETTKPIVEVASKEEMSTKKLLLLKDKQIQLESILLSETLFGLMKTQQEDDTVSISDFKIVLEKAFGTLELKAKYREVMTQMSGEFRMVLINLIGGSIEMANFEIKKVLHNFKERGTIIEYSVNTNGDSFECSLKWKSVDELPTNITIRMNEQDGVQVEFE